MDAPAILRRLRDRVAFREGDLKDFARGLADGSVSDAQAGAFAMGAFLNKLSEADRVALTLAMRDSGEVLRWDLPGPVVDKHSSGGIGDCVSLTLAPALAACGAYVPMISGRGLGHTGGTLDKLEAIPGYSTAIDGEALHKLVADHGAAIVAASARIAPADKKLYAVRDVTSTVESIDLITASILSKKLAAGLEALVLDVKAGSGAFMKTAEDAHALAQSLVSTANGAGCRTAALITDMNAPCVPAVGNAVEVREVMKALTGEDPGVLRALTETLGGEALFLAGLADTAEAGEAMIAATLADGRAAEGFARMVAAQGGPADILKTWESDLREAPVIREVPAPHAGYLTAMDGEAVGQVVVHLGGGRLREDDKIDHSVGLSTVVPLGAKVDAGAPLALVHARDEASAEAAIKGVQAALVIAQEAPAADRLIKERIAP